MFLGLRGVGRDWGFGFGRVVGGRAAEKAPYLPLNTPTPKPYKSFSFGLSDM